MKVVNLEKSILNLQIKSLDGIPNLLYSEEIYDSEIEIGIELPIDRLCEIGNNTIVLIGVSGCGKTRTCYDLCRRYWGLYFDCTIDTDILEMIGMLDKISPAKKSEQTQTFFEKESNRFIECLISARLLVLQTILEHRPNLKCFEWLCIQRSQGARTLFSEIFTKLSLLPLLISSAIHCKLKFWFVTKAGRIIFDESQHLLERLKNDYRSSRSHQQEIKDGHFFFPRSFFSFLSRTIIHTDLKSIWCGTQMRISSMELIYSAAGSKPEGIYIFTDFTFLEPSHIFKLLPKWLKVDATEYVDVFQEISNVLQGRPRFLISFLHKLINSSDIDGCFRSYVKNMTTECGPESVDSSIYSFWKQRIDWSIQPLEKTNTSAFETRKVSDMLVKLCISFLFGDGSRIVYSPDLDLVSTCLVMVTKTTITTDEWHATMAEPIVLSAGLNYLKDTNAPVLMDFFAHQLFSPPVPPNLSFQERGYMMELVIALKFIEGWWLKPELKKHLPQWAVDLDIQKPIGVIDCRSKEPNATLNVFVQQLRNPKFPWIIFPAANAGPDLRYSIFCGYVKTTSTPNSQSTMYVGVDECKKNIGTMDPKNWYKSQEGSVQKECLSEIKKVKFIHLRFELPDTAPSMKETFISGPKDNDYIICVNLESTFAQDFFGESFVRKYKEFVSRSIGHKK